MDELTRKKIQALLHYLKNEAQVTETASRLAQMFDLDLVIIRSLADDEGIRLRDTGEVGAVDPDADTARVLVPKKGNGKP